MENVKKSILALQQGLPIIIVDSYDRENEGDLVCAAQTFSDETMNFMVLHSSGVICMATTEEQLQKIGLPLAETGKHKRDRFSTAFAHSFESATGITTGVSARDRAKSIRVASNPDAKVEDIISPGHVFALQARNNLLDERQGHTEASVQLCLLANLNPVAALVEIRDNDGGMLKGDSLRIFAKTYRLPIVSVEEIIAYKNNKDYLVTEFSKATLPTKFGEFIITVWHNENKEEIVTLHKGDLSQNDIPLRLHSKCLTGDVFHSLKCDCMQQLHSSLNYINQKGVGLLLYLDQEGRGTSIGDKIKAYALQEKGYDTVQANIELGLPVDNRTWDFALAVLKQYKLKSIEVITNNPDKVSALKHIYRDNIKIKVIPSLVNTYNSYYLDTKINKLKHTITKE